MPEMWAYGQQRAEYDRLSQIIERQVGEIEEMEEQLSSIESYLPVLDGNIDGVRRQIQAITQQIDGTPAYEQLKRAQFERTALQSARKAKSVEARPLRQAIVDLRDAAFSSSFPRVRFPVLAEFADSLHSRDIIGSDISNWPSKPRDVAELVSEAPPLSDAIGHLQSIHEGAAGEYARLKKETDDLDRNLDNLRAGGRMMSKDAQDFLEDLKRLGVECPTLSDVANIAPQFAEWRGIIEAILGDWCDAAIVDPSRMDSAYSHFDNHYKGTRAKLIQTENLRSEYQAPPPNTLAEAVRTDDRFAPRLHQCPSRADPPCPFRRRCSARRPRRIRGRQIRSRTRYRVSPPPVGTSTGEGRPGATDRTPDSGSCQARSAASKCGRGEAPASRPCHDPGTCQFDPGDR